MDSETILNESVSEINSMSATSVILESSESENIESIEDKECITDTSPQHADNVDSSSTKVSDDNLLPINERNPQSPEKQTEHLKNTDGTAQSIPTTTIDTENNTDVGNEENTNDFTKTAEDETKTLENVVEEDVVNKCPNEGVEISMEETTLIEKTVLHSKESHENIMENEEDEDKQNEDAEQSKMDLDQNTNSPAAPSDSGGQDSNLEKPSEFTHVNVDHSESTAEDSEMLAQLAKNALAEAEDMEAEIEIEDSNKLQQVPDDTTKQDETSQDSNAAMEVDMASENMSEKSPVVVEETDTSDKENAEKNQEPENTEFVQISQEQDKQDDGQIEGQSMEAEDPFGGDNLYSATTEQMETDAIESRANFEKLGEQADNLQAVVNAKGSSKEPEKKLPEDDLSDKVEKSSKSTTDVSRSSEMSIVATKADKSNKADKDSEKATDKSDADVLPGQDDELCIIPDSMKIILPKKGDSEAVDDKDVSQLESMNKTVNKSPENGEDAKVAEDNNSNPVVELVEKIVTEKSAGKQDAEKEIFEKEPVVTKVVTTAAKVLTVATNVIDIDEESKGSDEVEEISNGNEMCKQCKIIKPCKLKVKSGAEIFSVCSRSCKMAFQESNNKAMDIPSDGVNSKKEKRCASCLLIVEANDERNLSWETMEFCNEECLGKFQTKYGSYCRNCNGPVQAVSLGKYCVRFGYDVRQFCCSTCLEEFKKGLKVCSYCQKDISAGTEGFLAPVGDKGQFKDFCTQECMEKYSRMSSSEPYIGEKKACGVCQEEKIVYCEVQIDRSPPVPICSDPCYAAFKFVNKVDPEQCSTCKKYFENPNKKGFVVFYEKEAHSFCSKTCLNVFIITNRKIVPCNWCKVKKYNFDMIKKELKIGQVIMMCSLNCLTLYQVSINAVSAKRIRCDYCKEFSQAQYHLTMSDATIRNFCSYTCVMNFQGQYTKSPITIPSSDDPVPTGLPKRTMPVQRTLQTTLKPSDLQNKKTMPVISSVTSLASLSNGQTIENSASQASSKTAVNVQSLPVSSQTQVIYKQQIITRPSSPIKVHNRTTQCKPVMHTKGVSVRPRQITKSMQTEEMKKTIIPIPVPIYVPYPVHMFSLPFPIPVPIPLPVPVPIFIPTTRNSAKGIFKEIKRIQEKMPADPFEAELLMMAEMVATEKKNESDSDSGDDNRDDGDDQGNAHSDSYSPEGVDSSNTFGEDMLQMALKMATGEIEEPAVDLEAALTPNTITPQAQPQSETTVDNDAQPERLSSNRGKKRLRTEYKPRVSKRRRASGTSDIPLMPPPETQPPPQPRFMEPAEKPDANMALKYTFGVNAWRQWVVAKNVELEKQNIPSRKLKLFKTDLLQLTADELNYSLCLFVKEVRKPSGSEYAPDTIYYLCLGIQQYLFENNRIDNIFTDSYYEKFTDCLNEIAKKFSVIYNDSQYIVTRVEEEHLWECKQLGAHSPHVLLSTLMFFNTKHFNLVTVEEHMQLSFSHIMKHWKRNPAAQPSAVAGKVPGSRNVLLRFYPPQSALEANSRKKKVYEQQENEENPLRCPVKLYEFYLSKCPESVKTRNDIFYLLPERSCVPDSPVWYSTSPLDKDHLVKMLHRIKMVKEINVALLSS